MSDKDTGTFGIFFVLFHDFLVLFFWEDEKFSSRKGKEKWEGLFFPSKRERFPVGRINISYTHRKNFPFAMGTRKDLFFQLENVSTSRGIH